jgi:hypothetical protein
MNTVFLFPPHWTGHLCSFASVQKSPARLSVSGMSPGFVVGAAVLRIGGDFKPARYTRAVTWRYTSDRVLSFLFSHQQGGNFWRYDIVDIVGRYSVPTRTCHLTKKSFVTSCVTNRQTLKDCIYLVLFIVTKTSLCCVITFSLHFTDSNTFCCRKKDRSRWIHEISPIQYFIFLFVVLVVLFSKSSVMYLYHNIKALPCNHSYSGKLITNILSVYL